MTRRERRFVAHFLIVAEATEAARRAGYSEATARLTGPRLLQKPLIRAAIAREQEAQALRTGLSLERVLAEYVRLALADVGRLLAWGRDGVRVKPLADWSADEAAAIAAVRFADDRQGRQQVRVELHNKKYALAVLETYFQVGEPPVDATGARDRLLFKMREQKIKYELEDDPDAMEEALAALYAERQAKEDRRNDY